MATKGDISDLDVLSYGGVNIVPQLSGYSHSQISGAVSSSVAGGTTRQRKKYFNQPHRAAASFFFDNVAMQDYAYYFFNKNEGKYFICHLMADRPIVEPYVVQVIGSASKDYSSQHDGLISVELEIVSARDKCLDDWIIIASCYGKPNMPCDVHQVIMELP
tara:strand:- start:6726 stop:7208 length:483 start_codon:yes stop_codon:yes gene_type:complete